MVSMSVDIDLGAVHRLDTMLTRIQREYPGHVAGSVRRAGLYMLRSFKARTIKAPKKMRSSEYKFVPMKGEYITNKKTGRVLHRWEFTHLPGTHAQKVLHFAAYATRSRSKDTKWKWRGLNRAEERREIVKYRDLMKVRRAGLAKLSWDWIARQVMNSASSVFEWRRMKGEKRDPRNFVKGIFRRIVDKGAEMELVNSLDYILSCLPAGAIEEAITAASNRLEHNLKEDFPALKEATA